MQSLTAVFVAPLCTLSCKFTSCKPLTLHANRFFSSDIEQEVNGFYSFNREEKLDSTKVKAVFDDAMARFYKRVNALN